MALQRLAREGRGRGGRPLGKDTRHKHGGYYTTEYTAGLEGKDHPWEESRGMGFSYGYNRAETLRNYRTARELVLMLVDLVSRGGNLLLDIGPTGDGRIPVIMEERLEQMGAWLEVNGEAIYGTHPWSRTRQWSPGEQPKLETGEFNSRYEVTDYLERRTPGQAVIQAFFTSKPGAVYASVPGVPGGRLTLDSVKAPASMKPVLLGSNAALEWKATGDSIVVDLPHVPPPAPHAYVLKARRTRSALARRLIWR